MAELEKLESIESAVPANRASRDRFDLMVIGGGSAGFAAAIRSAELGFSVALVEADTIGGTCVNIGCIPSKALIRAVEAHHQAGEQRFRGIETLQGRIEWPQVLAHKDELVLELRKTRYTEVLAAYPDIVYIQGRARLTGENGVAVDGGGYRPSKIIITTGAKPWAPPIPGLDEHPYMDSTSALDLKPLPRSMIVLGANAVGLELAQLYARTGTEVTLVEVLPRIAPFEDPAVSAALTGHLEEEGLHITTRFETREVVKRNGRYHLTGSQDGATRTFEAEQLLVATGRRPNTAGLGLAEAGVMLGERGEILVDDRLQTHNPFVYAAGDVIGKDMFVYVAAYGGMLASENALTGAGRTYDASYVPRLTFTDPQIASAGLTEDRARQQGYDVKVSTLPMGQVPHAQAGRDPRGLIKLVADAATDRLLGAHILASNAGEMIQTAVLAIRFGITVGELRDTMFPYLTSSEGLKLAAIAFEKDLAKLSCCAG